MHTPGPWKVDGKNQASIFTTDENELMVATCEFGPCAAEKRANAEFIVRACNSHDELLAACKAAKKYLEPDLVEPGRTVFWNLVAAIAKAEGNQP